MSEDYEIKIVTTEMVEAAMDFAWENFFPDAPVNRSLGTKRGYLTELWVRPHLDKGLSLAAFDKEGKMLALRAGKAGHADDRFKRFMDTSPLVLNTYMACLRYFQLATNPEIVLTLVDRIGYSPYTIMDRLGARKWYEALFVCTSRAARGKGLGKKLVAESIKLAKEQGCEYMCALVTGNYSQKIFGDLGFSVESELLYSEFVDEEGKPLLNDTREHKKAQVSLLKL